LTREYAEHIFRPEVEMDVKQPKSLISSISDVQENTSPSVRLTVPVRPDQEELLRLIHYHRLKNQMRVDWKRMDKFAVCHIFRYNLFQLIIYDNFWGTR
jgi:hypothetical protein